MKDITGISIFVYDKAFLCVATNASTSDFNQINKSLKLNSDKPEWSVLCEDVLANERQ